MSKAAKFINSKIRVLSNVFDDPHGESSRNMYMGNYNIVHNSRGTLKPTQTDREYWNLVNIGNEASEKRRSSNRRRSIDERSSRIPTNERSSVNPLPVLETVYSSVAVGPSSDGIWDGMYSDPLSREMMYNGEMMHNGKIMYNADL